jgi:hypothetical protein
MAIGFMGIVAAALSERISTRAGRRPLIPLALLGAANVWYWRWSAAHGVENLNPYGAVQFGSALLVLLLIVLFPPRYTRGRDFFAVAGLYALAKVAEHFDRAIFTATAKVVSGHTLMHLLAATAIFWLLRIIKLRAPINGAPLQRDYPIYRSCTRFPMSLIRLFACLLILTAAMGLSSCSTNVSHDRDGSISVPPGATVAFAPGIYEGRENLDPAVANDIVHRRIEGAIVNELQVKGFKLVDDPETADFLVRFIVRVRLSSRQVATTTGLNSASPWGPGWGTSWGTGFTTVQSVTVTNASLVVDLVQRSTGNTAWRGVWQGDPGTRAPTQREIDNMMRRIFRSAPAAG